MAKGQEESGTAEDEDVTYRFRGTPRAVSPRRVSVSATFPRVSGRNTHV